MNIRECEPYIVPEVNSQRYPLLKEDRGVCQTSTELNSRGVPPLGMRARDTTLHDRDTSQGDFPHGRTTVTQLCGVTTMDPIQGH